MTRNRYLPFGYHYKDGIVAVHEAESEVVQMIFRIYLNGDGLQSISDALAEGTVAYALNGSHWNKHMVGRILQNQRYLGQGDYPPIIQRDVFDAVQELRKSKHTSCASKANSNGSPLEKRLYCGCCQSVLVSTSRRKLWRCTTKDCVNSVKVDLTELKPLVLKLLEHLCAEPHMVVAPPIRSHVDTLEVSKLRCDIQRAANTKPLDEAEAQRLINRYAGLLYAITDDGTEYYEGLRIQKLLDTAMPDWGLFHDIADKVLVNENGIPSLMLKNHQIYKGRTEDLC